MIKRVRIDGCSYRTLDLEAGIRAYIGPRGAKRFWHGYYYSGKAIDHFTGGVIPIVDSASRQEYDLFEDHYDLVRDLVGDVPQTATGDKGFLSRERLQEVHDQRHGPRLPLAARGW
jgi:hypothetical protein